MMQAPRIVRWTLPALLLTLVVGGAIIVAVNDGDSPPAALDGSPAAQTNNAPGERTARGVTMRDGDTATSIAGRAKLTLLALLELNPNVDPRALRPGQQRKISR